MLCGTIVPEGPLDAVDKHESLVLEREGHQLAVCSFKDWRSIGTTVVWTKGTHKFLVKITGKGKSYADPIFFVGFIPADTQPDWQEKASSFPNVSIFHRGYGFTSTSMSVYHNKTTEGGGKRRRRVGEIVGFEVNMTKGECVWLMGDEAYHTTTDELIKQPIRPALSSYNTGLEIITCE